ncbi:MAG: hypothetical protein ACK53Y_07950 [bacterium]
MIATSRRFWCSFEFAGGGGEESTGKKDGQGLKDPCGGGGQYKMYIIFIKFISRSKKLKPKLLSCV